LHPTLSDDIIWIGGHPMLSMPIDSEIERRLEALGAKTDRSKTALLRKTLLQALEDLEDVRTAETRLENPCRRWTQEELEQGLDLAG
jgi:predicted DNA-binding protein